MRSRIVTTRFPWLAVALVLGASFGLGGCGTLRIHRPQDLANAQNAQAQYRAADLEQAVAAERARLDQVLAEELELVRQHTVARRDARLLYVIGQGGTQEAWDFLEADLAKRLERLGFDSSSQLEDRLRRDAEAKRQLVVLNKAAEDYEVEREKDPSLPPLTCPEAEGATPPPLEAMEASLFWEEYARECKEYLAIVRDRRVEAEGHGTPRRSLGEPLANGPAIQALEAARAAAQKATAAASRALAEARRAHAAGQPADRQSVRDAARELIDRAQRVKTALEAFVAGNDRTALDALDLGGVADQIATARSTLQDVGGLDLSSVLGDLSSVPLLAELEAVRSEVVAGLSSTLQGETATRVLESLGAIEVALAGPRDSPVTAMVLKERQLALDIAAARKRAAFYDKTLALLKQQEEAYRDELSYLGQAELRRQELVERGCLSGVTHEDSEFLSRLFTEEDAAVVACREIVFRLLVQYSAAWTFGRVESEQVDYRLIALHHVSALDTSDIAFQKWASLLGPPIDQLVAFSETGIRPADLVTPIVNAFGLGAVAAGVN